MAILLAFLIGVAVNLDNFLIGMNLGIQGQKLTVKANLIIGITTGICAFAATYAAILITGKFLLYTNYIGAITLIVFGAYCFFTGLASDVSDDKISAMSLKDVCILGFVLAVNCIPPSFSAGVMQLSPYYVAFFSATCSFVCMHISNKLGNRLIRCRFPRYLTAASSILLVLIGIMQLVS